MISLIIRQVGHGTDLNYKSDFAKQRGPEQEIVLILFAFILLGILL